MPTTLQSLRNRGRGPDNGVALAVEGLAPLQRALRNVDKATAKELKEGLKDIGKGVQRKAKENAPEGPRPKRSDAPKLKGSIRVSATTRGVSVYSNAPHAYVQDRGGRVGRNRATILQRGNVSAYMTKAQRSEQPHVSRRLQGLLDSIGKEFEK